MITHEKLMAWRKRTLEIIEVAKPEDRTSRAYDLLNMLTIVINLVVSLAFTFEQAREACGGLLVALESVTVVFFAVDYALRRVYPQFCVNFKCRCKMKNSEARRRAGYPVRCLAGIQTEIPPAVKGGGVSRRLYTLDCQRGFCYSGIRSS